MTDLTLVTDRLILRPPAQHDLDRCVAFSMSERAKFVGGHVPEFRAWMTFAGTLGHWQLRGFGLWAVTAKGDDTIIGLVGPFYPDGWPETEIGWMMFDGSEGKGFAQEAAVATLQDARDRLGWTNIVHYIDPLNTRSIVLAQRLGANLDPHGVVPKPEAPCLVFRQPQRSVAA